MKFRSDFSQLLVWTLMLSNRRRCRCCAASPHTSCEILEFDRPIYIIRIRVRGHVVQQVLIGGSVGWGGGGVSISPT